MFQVDTLFEMNSPLCWDSSMLGYYAAAYIGTASLLGLLLAKTLCCRDTTIALLAGANCVLKAIYTGLVTNTIMMFCGQCSVHSVHSSPQAFTLNG